jgi:N-methylhydantoinase A
MARTWIGIDTGGTFTDLALCDLAKGTYWFHKTATTPQDPAEGILRGITEILELAGAVPAEIDFLCHGTTLATNAILEGKYARTGMITTAGFRDILEIARQRRPSFFNLDVPKPTPPAMRDVRSEVRERIGPDGSVIESLDQEAVRAAARRLRDAGCKAVAVCFLHAYANKDHEEAAARIIREIWPEAYLCTSSEVLAEFREYERFATATVNAALLPVMDDYLQRFERGVAALGIPSSPSIMQSNGGAASPHAARKLPVNTFFSGPAGGVIGAAHLGAKTGASNLITFDMGGTSTDVALIQDGVPGRKNVREMAGFPVRTRILDIHTIGAGGGSIAWIDDGGLLKVGPKSAGARPGPPSYGHGGVDPTVTDANMVLGRLNQVALLDGGMPVFPDRGREAIEKNLCAPLGISLERAAAGVLEIVNTNMMGAVRVISVERGQDPRRFALMAFGGAGPLHACDVAAIMGIRHVIVPPRPGVLSAVGLLFADIRGDFSLTRVAMAEEPSLGIFQDGFVQLGERADAWLATENVGDAPVARELSMDMRYFGQNFELSAPLRSERPDVRELHELVERFHRAHEESYGYRLPDRPIEIVNLRLSVSVGRPLPPEDWAAPATDKVDEALAGTRQVWFPASGFIETPVYRRDRIPTGKTFAGPAVVEQMDTTTIVPPDAAVTADRAGNLAIELADVSGKTEESNGN